MPKISERAKQDAGRIIEVLVRDEQLLAQHIEEMTGLSSTEAVKLRSALENDGKIDSNELKQFATGSRLHEIASYIGDKPLRLFKAALIFTDARAYLRCGSEPKFGVKNRDAGCGYTLEGVTQEEQALEAETISDLNHLLDQGFDIYPAIKKMGLASWSALTNCSKLNLSKLAPGRRTELLNHVNHNIIERNPDPVAFLLAVELMAKLGPEGRVYVLSLKNIMESLARTSRSWTMNERHVQPVRDFFTKLEEASQ